MNPVARCVVLLFVVYVSVLEAELTIRVSYNSQDGYVSRDLKSGEIENIQLATENVSYSCIGGNFTHSLPDSYLIPREPYSAINTSTYLIRIIYFNVFGFTKLSNCSNGTDWITARIAFSGIGLLWTETSADPFEFHRLPPGGSVRVNSQSTYFIGCLSAFNQTLISQTVQLFHPNGSVFPLRSSSTAIPTNRISASQVPQGFYLYLPLAFTEGDEGEYRCVNVNADNQPENFTFTLHSGSDPCGLTSCPDFSVCENSSLENLCQCQFPFLEYRDARCRCHAGFALNATSPPLNCSDTDECLVSLDPCHLKAANVCVNTEGSYRCECPPGLSSVGDACQHPCDTLGCSLLNNKICQRNVSGNFSCQCIAGYMPLNSSHCSPFASSIPHSITPTPLPSSSSINVIRMSSSISHAIAPTPSPSPFSTSLPSSSSINTIRISSSISHSIAPTPSPSPSPTPTTPTPTTPTTQSTMELLDQLKRTPTLTTEMATMYLSDLEANLDQSSDPSNVESGMEALKLISDKITSISDSQTRTFVRILEKVIAPSVLSALSEDGKVEEVVNDIIGTLENIAQLLAPVYFGNDTVIDNGSIRLEVKTIPTDGRDISIGKYENNDTVAQFSFGAFNFTCKENPCNTTGCKAVAVAIEIKNINDYIRTNFTGFQSWFCTDVEMDVNRSAGVDQSVNTNVFSFNIASINCNVNTSNLVEPIKIHFPIQNEDLMFPSCAALLPGSDGLIQDESSCETLPSDSGNLTCSCSHLTSFAILMSPDPQYQSMLPMDIATYVCLSISILSLAIALFIYTFVRFKVSIAIFFVHYNLMVAVLISEVVFIVGINRSEFKELCLIVAISLHYILLVSFLWMFFEVFNLLVLVMRPSVSQKKVIHLYWPIAYGLPLIVVAATTGISYCDYGSYAAVDYPEPISANCWLPRRNGRYWAFIGPSLFIILVNTVLIILLSVRLIHYQLKRSSYRASALNTSKSRTLANGFASAIRGSLLLVPIVGFTWIFGAFAINSTDTPSLVFNWLFILFNGLQGFFIFLFYCILKTEVRDAFLLLLLRKVLRREVRLAEGETLFSSYRKKSSVFSESRGTLTRSSNQDMNLIPISPAKKKLSGTQTAFVNPINQK